jgi:hypothetical protein
MLKGISVPTPTYVEPADLAALLEQVESGVTYASADLYREYVAIAERAGRAPANRFVLGKRFSRLPGWAAVKVFTNGQQVRAWLAP